VNLPDLPLPLEKRDSAPVFRRVKGGDAFLTDWDNEK
jgi:hypothetical protein